MSAPTKTDATTVHKRRLLALRAKRDRVNLDIEATAPLAFPKGTRVYWEHGQHMRAGVVEEHAWDRVKVIAPSGARYWVHLWRLVK